MKNSHVKYENAFFLLIHFILSISRVNKPQTTTMKARERITAAIIILQDPTHHSDTVCTDYHFHQRLFQKSHSLLSQFQFCE